MKTGVVIGGGISGLASAQVLSKHCEKVILYKGQIPYQQNHLHVLLKSGQITLERIFPGILKDFRQHHSPEIDWARDTRWKAMDKFFPRYPSQIHCLSFSRELLQKHMIEKLKYNIEIREEMMDLEQFKKLEASFIVLATGNSKLINEAVQEVKTTSLKLTYRSQVFPTAELVMMEAKQYYSQILPPQTKRGVVICPIENNQSMVTLIEQEEQFSKINEDEFRFRLQTIPEIATVIKEARPVQALHQLRKETSTRTHIHFNLLPKHAFLMGDIHTSLNPVFGQGMSLALLEAELLDEALINGEHSQTFHKKVQKIIKRPYALSQLGTQEKGPARLLMKMILKLCQKRIFFHGQFLHFLHSLGFQRRIL